ncbi:MAG TPA: HAMP domain-containing protein, partial [Thermoplasmatales archaeon]|nr:HAMP domain-containing protein [Thermoplasmatales archaeon]
RTTKPIKELTYATEKIANGDFRCHVDIKSGDELEQLGRSFNKMVNDLKKSQEIILNRNREIEKLLEQKDAFINQLSHDLKTPLTPLITLPPILRKRINDPKAQEMIDAIIQSSNYMKDLITRLLQLAKLNAPSTKFHFEEAFLF